MSQLNTENSPGTSTVESRPVLRIHGRTIGSLLLICTGAVALFDFLFFRQPIGWTVGLFGLVLIVVAFWRFERLRQDRHAAWFALAAMAPMIASFEEPGFLLSGLGLLGLMTLALIGAYGWDPSGLTWVARWFQLVSIGGVRALVSLRHLGRKSRDASGGAQTWLLPLGMTMAFLTLFAIANPIFEKSFRDAWDAIDLIRVDLWAIAGLACWTWLVSTIDAPHPFTRIGSKSATAPIGDRVLIQTLICCNLVFALHSSLDVVYLLGGAKLPDGMTYAEYAHRGAYPLIVAALLAAAFILLSFRPGARTSAGARNLALLWTVQTILLTVASIWRLWLYVEFYNLTRWRVAAAIWMGLVAAGLAWIGARIVLDRSNTWLINANLVTALTVLFLVGLSNVDGYIAFYNVRHCKEVSGTGSQLDARYMIRLGPAALPAIHWMDRALIDPSSRPHRLFDDSVMIRLEQQRSAQLENWRGWTLRRRRLAEDIRTSGSVRELRPRSQTSQK